MGLPFRNTQEKEDAASEEKDARLAVLQVGNWKASKSWRTAHD